MDFFRYPKFLLLMILVDVILVMLLYFAYLRKKTLIKKIVQAKLLDKLIPSETKNLRKIKMIVFISAISFVFISWALPQWGVEFTSSTTKAGQVVIAVDTSLSMLVEDIKPSRIENSKTMFKVLINRLSGYRTGIIAFSDRAYVQCPITTDEDALKYFISQLYAGMLPTQGTSISAPLNLASELLSKYPGQKALILLTDGEAHDKSEIKNALENAKKSGVVIFTVGIGNPDGGLIPIGGGSFKMDEKGNPVVSRLDEETLIELAAQTGGAYIRYSDVQTVSDELAGQLKNLTKTQWQGKVRQVYKNRYQIPLFIAILLLLLELIVPERKFKLWKE